MKIMVKKVAVVAVVVLTSMMGWLTCIERARNGSPANSTKQKSTNENTAVLDCNRDARSTEANTAAFSDIGPSKLKPFHANQIRWPWTFEWWRRRHLKTRFSPSAKGFIEPINKQGIHSQYRNDHEEEMRTNEEVYVMRRMKMMVMMNTCGSYVGSWARCSHAWWREPSIWWRWEPRSCRHYRRWWESSESETARAEDPWTSRTAFHKYSTLLQK